MNCPLSSSSMQFSHFVGAKDPWELSAKIYIFLSLCCSVITQKRYRKHQNLVSMGTLLAGLLYKLKKSPYLLYPHGGASLKKIALKRNENSFAFLSLMINHWWWRVIIRLRAPHINSSNKHVRIHAHINLHINLHPHAISQWELKNQLTIIPNSLIQFWPILGQKSDSCRAVGCVQSWHRTLLFLRGSWSTNHLKLFSGFF